MTPAIERPSEAGTWSCRLVERRRLTAGTFELRLTRPPGFAFQAGQRIALRTEATERDYTLVGAPADEDLAVLVRLIPAGRLTPFLDQAPIGSELLCSGPSGYFCFRPDPRPAVMVASGTGIAPFTAMVRAGVRPFMLLHGVRTAAELYYREELQTAAVRYIPCLSTKSLLPGRAFGGYVTDYLQTRLDPQSCDFYLSGRMEMIRDAMQIIDARFPAARVYSEAFF